jgi:hypothetical protein
LVILWDVTWNTLDLSLRKEGVAIHLTIATISIFFVLLTRAWKKFSDYHPTILYMVAGNLLYLFFSKNYLLWGFVSEYPGYQAATELLYAFIVFPATVLLYLNGYPQHSNWKKIVYILWWVTIYGTGEWLLYQFGGISYDHKWNCAWSIAFDFLMFPMLLLHNKKPLVAYGVSIIIIEILLYWFDVPVSTV